MTKGGVMSIRDNIRGGALTETTLLVLLALYRPNHGYGVSQFVVQETGGRVKLGAGTLYGAIDNLSRKKWITPLKDSAFDCRRVLGIEVLCVYWVNTLCSPRHCYGIAANPHRSILKTNQHVQAAWNDQ